MLKDKVVTHYSMLHDNAQVAFLVDGQWRTVYAAYPGRLTAWTTHQNQEGFTAAGVTESSHRQSRAPRSLGPVAVTPMYVPETRGRPGPTDDERKSAPHACNESCAN